MGHDGRLRDRFVEAQFLEGILHRIVDGLHRPIGGAAPVLGQSAKVRQQVLNGTRELPLELTFGKQGPDCVRCFGNLLVAQAALGRMGAADDHSGGPRITRPFAIFRGAVAEMD